MTNVFPLHTPFNLCCIDPRFFGDTVEAMRWGLSELGYPVHVHQGAIAHGAINVIFGGHLLPDWSGVPTDSILFNLEQLGSTSAVMTPAYQDALSRFAVFDYSRRNVEWLTCSGINPQAQWVGIGYASTLERVTPAPDPDIDVLFYGLLNERRRRVLSELEASGLRVVALTGVFGAALDPYIARAKVVLNVHFYETHQFEVVRVGYLLNNRVAVVSEISADTDIDDRLRVAVCGADYDALASECLRLVRDPAARMALAEQGYRTYRAWPQTAFLQAALQSLYQSRSR